MSGPAALLPLTRSQHLIWTGQQLQPDEPLYNMVLSFAIDGPVDPTVFAAAFDRLVQHADALRITFEEHDGVPRQRVNDRLHARLEHVDLSRNDDVDNALDEWQRARARKLLDPSECLFDACLVRLSATRWVWYFNQHHLTTDAWSTSVLFKHLSTLYEAQCRNAMDDVEPLPAFTAYVRKEQAARDSKSAERALAYWTKRLAEPGAPSSFYRATPTERSGRTRRVPCAFGAERTQKMTALTAEPAFRAITPELARAQCFATVYFAWLHRLSGERQLSIGMPTHNRSAATFRRTAGMFIEVFPLKVTVDDDESFASLYEKVATATRDLLINAPSGSTSFEHQRNFDVVLNSITARYGHFAGMPMRSTWVHADHGDRNHLVRIQVEDFDQSDALRVFFDVHDDVFNDHDVYRAERDFLTLFDAMLRDPEQRLQRVSLLDHDATAHKLALGASRANNEPPSYTVLDMIDAVAARSPDQVAIRGLGTTVTYRQLTGASATLAKQLVESGVTPGSRVVIALPRSARAVAAILACLRAGAAYVPLDLAYPRERLALMIDDADPTLIVHEGEAAPAGTSRDVATLSLNALPDANEDDAGASVATLDDLAYIIYTSGSTGTPKGRTDCASISGELRALGGRPLPRRSAEGLAAVFVNGV